MLQDFLHCNNTQFSDHHSATRHGEGTYIGMEAPIFASNPGRPAKVSFCPVDRTRVDFALKQFTKHYPSAQAEKEKGSAAFEGDNGKTKTSRQ